MDSWRKSYDSSGKEKGKIDVFDLENEFYLVTFQNMEDYMEALIGEPWVISNAYLSVGRWKPEFNMKHERIESIVAWVRFLDLPAPLFDKKFLLNLGNSSSKAIRLDVHTAKRTRGRFARMCVELDLKKPLVPEFNVEGQVLSVVYESLGQLCNKCGRMGHLKEGSRFAALQVDTEDVPIVGKVAINHDPIVNNVVAQKGQGVKGRVSQPSKKETETSERVILKGATIEGGNVGLRECNRSFDESVIVPETNLKPRVWQGVHMENKENLNPGECGISSRHKGVEDIGGMRAEDILVDQTDDISMSMVEDKFEEAEVRVLPRIFSDHHPLLVSSSVERKEWRKRCFRYEAMWKMHDQFDNIMACSWYGNEAAPVKLVSLKQELIRWNHEVFGILASRKRRLHNRLYGI
ncbi:hypothetical protein K1719_026637 [Acacia pycnantha]|nr:hypothetical protein K1719_026637 [Acacia pycnantha]